MIALLLHAGAHVMGQRAENAGLEKLDTIYRHLRLSPLTIDGRVLEPAGKLNATATLISGSRTELEVPESAGADQGGHVIGQVAWFVKCTGGSMQNAHSSSRHGVPAGQARILRTSRLLPGANASFQGGDPRLETGAIGITLDLKELNLDSGTYRLTLVFNGLTKFTLSGSAVFYVNNPGFKTAESKSDLPSGDRPKKEIARAAPAPAEVDFPKSFVCGNIETASDKHRPDKPFSASCTVTYAQNAPASVPASFRGRQRGNQTLLAEGFWYLQKKGSPIRISVGNSPLISKEKDLLSPMENFVCSVEVPTERLKLTTGTYELSFELMLFADNSRRSILRETRTIVLQR